MVRPRKKDIIFPANYNLEQKINFDYENHVFFQSRGVAIKYYSFELHKAKSDIIVFKYHISWMPGITSSTDIKIIFNNI